MNLVPRSSNLGIEFLVVKDFFLKMYFNLNVFKLKTFKVHIDSKLLSLFKYFCSSFFSFVALLQTFITSGLRAFTVYQVTKA